MANALLDFIRKFIVEYPTEKTKPFTGSEFGDSIRNTVPSNIVDAEIFDSNKYKIKASVGQSNWATIPWLAVFDKSIYNDKFKLSALRGVYIVYLRSADDQTLYLTFNQGCSDLRSEFGKKKAIEIMQERVQEAQQGIDARGFSTTQIDLHSTDSDAEMYEKGCFFSKVYDINNLPTEAELEDDLKNMIDIYSEYVSKGFWKPTNTSQKAGQSNNQGNNEEAPDMNDIKEFPLNMILYGPPGTGKTYNTATYAVAICDGMSISDVEAMGREAIKKRFEELKDPSVGRVAFTTFHQSYGYEEFIEGIKPDTNDQDESKLAYIKEDGVFKAFCKRASSAHVETDGSGTAIKDNPKIWGMLLGASRDKKTKAECFANEEIRLGWKEVKDEEIDSGEFDDDENTSWSAKHMVYDFKYSMEIGDLVVIEKSLTSICAIGIITGEYEVDEGRADFFRKRKVKWLVKDIDQSILEFLPGNRKQLARKSVFGFDWFGLKTINKILEIHGASMMSVHYESEPYVFIIDEINRGNISKIFGELITLIEESKREGAEDEESAILPYTNESFSVPNNVYILGTMNTADRSIALMDTALRRRFEFVEKMPKPELLDGVVISQNGISVKVDEMLRTINDRIEFLFDREHTIGHAFFMNLKDMINPSVSDLANIFKRKVVPLLQEYFYDDYEKIQLVLGDNGKDGDAYKFIKKDSFDPKKVFSGPTKLEKSSRYTINDEAFYHIESYVGIMKSTVKALDDDEEDE